MKSPGHIIELLNSRYDGFVIDALNLRAIFDAHHYAEHELCIFLVAVARATGNWKHDTLWDFTADRYPMKTDAFKKRFENRAVEGLEINEDEISVSFKGAQSFNVRFDRMPFLCAWHEFLWNHSWDALDEPDALDLIGSTHDLDDEEDSIVVTFAPRQLEPNGSAIEALLARVLADPDPKWSQVKECGNAINNWVYNFLKRFTYPKNDALKMKLFNQYFADVYGGEYQPADITDRDLIDIWSFASMPDPVSAVNERLDEAGKALETYSENLENTAQLLELKHEIEKAEAMREKAGEMFERSQNLMRRRHQETFEKVSIRKFPTFLRTANALIQVDRDQRDEQRLKGAGSFGAQDPDRPDPGTVDLDRMEVHEDVFGNAYEWEHAFEHVQFEDRKDDGHGDFGVQAVDDSYFDRNFDADDDDEDDVTVAMRGSLSESETEEQARELHKLSKAIKSFTDPILRLERTPAVRVKILTPSELKVIKEKIFWYLPLGFDRPRSVLRASAMQTMQTRAGKAKPPLHLASEVRKLAKDDYLSVITRWRRTLGRLEKAMWASLHFQYEFGALEISEFGRLSALFGRDMDAEEGRNVAREAFNGIDRIGFKEQDLTDPEMLDGHRAATDPMAETYEYLAGFLEQVDEYCAGEAHEGEEEHDTWERLYERDLDTFSVQMVRIYANEDAATEWSEDDE